jgi:hypothetical protein
LYRLSRSYPPTISPPIEVMSMYQPLYRAVSEASTRGLGCKRGSAKTALNKLKTPMAALATNVPQRPTEDVSRIRSVSAGYREVASDATERTPVSIRAGSMTRREMKQVAGP